MDAELKKIELEARVERDKLEAMSPAKEVAGKAIGKYGLAAIVIIVIIGVLASEFIVTKTTFKDTATTKF